MLSAASQEIQVWPEPGREPAISEETRFLHFFVFQDMT